jgi:hypothetical protein
LYALTRLSDLANRLLRLNKEVIMPTLETLAQGGAGRGTVGGGYYGPAGGESPKRIENSLIAADFSTHESYQDRNGKLMECVGVIALIGEAENVNLN